MPVTQEPRGLNWINNVNMGAFGPLTTQLCWVIGSVAFTYVASMLMLTLDGPSLTNGIPTDHSAIRQLGYLLAGSLLGAWGFKTGAGIYDNKKKREADPRYAGILEAKERGKLAAVANAAALKDAKKINGSGEGVSAAADAIRERIKRDSTAVPIPPEGGNGT